MKEEFQEPTFKLMVETFRSCRRLYEDSTKTTFHLMQPGEKIKMWSELDRNILKKSEVIASNKVYYSALEVAFKCLLSFQGLSFDDLTNLRHDFVKLYDALNDDVKKEFKKSIPHIRLREKFHEDVKNEDKSIYAYEKFKDSEKEYQEFQLDSQDRLELLNIFEDLMLIQGGNKGWQACRSNKFAVINYEEG